MRKIGLIALLIGIFFLASCNEASSKVISYCDPEDMNWKRGTMHIDLEKMRVFGDDTSSFIEMMEHGHLVGFNIPFPILLFDNTLDRSQLKERIVSGDYTFQFFAPESNQSDWWIITARLNKNKEGIEKSPHANTIILYSLEDGVLSIKLSSDFGSVINLIPCENKTLKYEDIKSVINRTKTRKVGATLNAEVTT